MLCTLNSLGLAGIDGMIVGVEVSETRGLPSFEILGLPDLAVKEARDRVRAVCAQLKIPLPKGKIIANLTPAEIRKTGPIYDLPIFAALVQLSGVIKSIPKTCAFVGELSLSGQVRPVTGILPMVIAAKAQGLQGVFVPFANAAEATAVQGIAIYPVKDVQQLVAHLNGEAYIDAALTVPFTPQETPSSLDFAQVRGQFEVKRGLEIAAAGGHNVLLIGPPGSGKSMLAQRIPTILPAITVEEAIAVTKVHSVAGLLSGGGGLLQQRPFRAPHHTVSPAGLAGGGTGAHTRPGELSLAHHGVLFLDELPEFQKHALEVLRQPMEDGLITISRAGGNTTYPCRIMLIAAMNPCPCGYYGHPTRGCSCTEHQIRSYMSRISGPMLDRLDLHIEVPPVEYSHLAVEGQAEASHKVRQRVQAARELQQQRLGTGAGATCNAQLSPDALRKYCVMTEDSKSLLKLAFSRMSLSARSYDRIIKIARTIADLAGSDVIDVAHISEAIQYRSLDRKYFNT